jgi:hypothetical protein
MLATYIAVATGNHNCEGLLAKHDTAVERLCTVLQHLARDICRLASVNSRSTGVRDDCRLSGYGCVMHVITLHPDADGARRPRERNAQPATGTMIRCRDL